MVKEKTNLVNVVCERPLIVIVLIETLQPAAMYRKFNVVFGLPVKTRNKFPSKVGYFSKIAEIFSAALAAQSVLKRQK